MEISIQLPFFPGFYETDYESSDTAYWAIKEELDYYQRDCVDEHPEYAHLTEDDLDFDYKQYESDVIDAFIEVFAGHTPEFVTNVRMDELDSPKYYNFRNDHLYAFVTLADDWKDKMRAFMEEDADWLRDRVREDWTSYDGFMSFMSNNFDNTDHDEVEDDWSQDKSWYFHLFKEEDARYIGTMIGYMMVRANKDVYHDIYMDAMEDIYAGSYVYILPEAKERLQEMLDSGEVQIPDPDQMQIPFEE